MPKNNAAKPVIGIIGAGRLGSTLARAFLAAGYEVNIANSKSPETMSLMMSMLLPGATALHAQDVAYLSDVVILATPLHKYRAFDTAWFKDKIVIDAMNYWPSTEGQIKEFDGEQGSSEILAKYFSGARLVKSFNHVAYGDLHDHAVHTPGQRRRAIAVASEDVDAKAIVLKLIDAIGFDGVDIGNLKAGRIMQPAHKLFNANLSANEIKAEAS